MEPIVALVCFFTEPVDFTNLEWNQLTLYRRERWHTAASFSFLPFATETQPVMV